MRFSELDNVAEPFLKSATEHPDKVAIIFKGAKVTYRQMNARINRFAHLLKEDAGVVSQDKVAYLLPNRPELTEIYYAVQKIGAVSVPLNFKHIAREVAYLVNASQAKVLFFDKIFWETVQQAQEQFDHPVCLYSVGGSVEGVKSSNTLLVHFSDSEPEMFRDAHALSRIQFTGGSTGLPKGAARTHAADLVELDSVTQSSGLADEGNWVALVQCPLEHHGGHSWFTSIFATASAMVVCQAFDAERILRDIDANRVTHMILLPPTTYQRLLRCPTIDQFDLSSVLIVQSAAGAAPLEMIRQVFEKFPNAKLNYGWGQSESGTGSSVRITRQMFEQGSPLLGSIGSPMPYTQMKVVDEDGRELEDGQIGEALIKSGALMEGYYGQPDLTEAAFTADGWLHTGDMMRRDDEGYYYLCSRKKDMIKSGGENVFVSEVESVLRSHPDIDDCVVFGTSDPTMGEAVAAVVQPRPGAVLTAAIVQGHCKTLLASYKKPRYVVFIDDIGRDDAGKVRKDKIVQYFNQHKALAAPKLYEKICDKPEIYLIQVPFSGGTPVGWTNVYYVRTAHRGLLVDAGTSHEASFEVLRLALEELKVDMGKTDIFLTHFHIDHLGLAAAVASPTSRIYLSATDEKMFEGRGVDTYRGTMMKRLEEEGFDHDAMDDLVTTDAQLIPRTQWPMPQKFTNLKDGDVLDVGGYLFRVIDTPGHTPGHQCLYLPGRNIMFFGDHVLFATSPNIAPFKGWEDPLDDFLNSLHKVRDIPVDLALFAHGTIDPRLPQDKLRQRIDWLVEHHHRRLAEIREVLAARPGMNGTEVAKSIHWNIPYQQWEEIPIIQRWIIVSESAVHLDYLVQAGLVRREVYEGINRYYVIQS